MFNELIPHTCAYIAKGQVIEQIGLSKLYKTRSDATGRVVRSGSTLFSI